MLQKFFQSEAKVFDLNSEKNFLTGAAKISLSAPSSATVAIDWETPWGRGTFEMEDDKFLILGGLALLGPPESQGWVN